MNIPARFRTLPGANKQAPPIAHTAADLEQSVAARIQKYFHARHALENILLQNWHEDELITAGLKTPRNPRQVVAEIEALLADQRDIRENRVLIEKAWSELLTTLEPLLERLPEP